MPSQAITTSARTLSRLPPVLVLEVHGDAAFVLLDAGALVVGANGVGAQPRQRRLIQDQVQPAAMDADFRIFVAGEFAARLLVDELAEAVEEAAFEVLDAGLEQLVAEAERGEFAHRMRQQRDADAELLESRARARRRGRRCRVP